MGSLLPSVIPTHPPRERSHTPNQTMKSLFILATLLAFAAGSDDYQPAPMISTAMEFLARASSTSEVLTLNLTNLLILLVLKALIFGFGLFSVGGTGRSADSQLVSQSDLTGGMCFLMYTSGAEEKFDCIQRTACEDPYLANDYLTAAKMWYKMHKMMGSIFPFDDKYKRVMHAVNEAKEVGLTATADECASYNW